MHFSLDDSLDFFDFIDETIIYVDAPLEGFVRSKNGVLYAFRVFEIIPAYLWHWVLVPAQSTSEPVSSAFFRAPGPDDKWLSILEDRRGEMPRITVAEFLRGRTPLPRTALPLRT
jgi:hypothetical protein